MARQVERLTALAVRNFTKPGMYADGDGLYLHIGPAGNRSWILRYRHAGKRRDMGLGRYPVFSLGEARERARKHRQLLADKIDPLTVRAKPKPTVPTFHQVAEECIKSIRADWRAPRHEKNWHNSLRDHVYPLLGAMPVDAIETPDVERVLRPIWLEKPKLAKDTRQRIERVLDFAKARTYRSGDNPAAWRGNLADLLPKGSRVEQGHHEALPYADAAAFMAAIPDTLAGKALAFTMLTAARTGEVLRATWSEFDLEARLWRVPAHHMKGGKEHLVPLSAPALAILAAIPRTGDMPFKIGDRQMYRAARLLRPEISVHGLRSTFSTWCQETQHFPPELVEHCLAHITGDASERAYKRGDAVDKRRQVMDVWARYCANGLAQWQCSGFVM